MFSQRQVFALKYLISVSGDMEDIGKQIMFFLIDQSNDVSKEVSIVLSAGSEGLSEEGLRQIALCFDHAGSSASATHIDQVMQVANSEFRFSCHGQQEEANPLSYRFWLARGCYPRNATIINVTLAQLKGISVEDFGPFN